ncbi:hypothetical protein T10_2815 [Trichinella papuae]|uniref:Uncharacterized protein n=1 Tax=Trichinella papuae TaxID=268474 RepID=A0A0V1M4U3_9BILA|nr:hypothetical protein T10_2815 [Trichinella papuae]
MTTTQVSVGTHFLPHWSTVTPVLIRLPRWTFAHHKAPVCSNKISDRIVNGPLADRFELMPTGSSEDSVLRRDVSDPGLLLELPHQVFPLPTGPQVSMVHIPDDHLHDFFAMLEQHGMFHLCRQVRTTQTAPTFRTPSSSRNRQNSFNSFILRLPCNSFRMLRPGSAGSTPPLLL